MNDHAAADQARAPLGRREDGVALIVTLMVLMLVSVLMVGFVAAIVADQRASGLDRDQTQAYAAAHAGLEQLTSDLTRLFAADFSPNATQIGNIAATPPTVPDSRSSPRAAAAGSGYGCTPRIADGTGNPLPEDPTNRHHHHGRPLSGLPRHHHAVQHHGHGAVTRRRRGPDAAHAADRRDSGVPVRACSRRPTWRSTPARKLSASADACTRTATCFWRPADSGSLTMPIASPRSAESFARICRTACGFRRLHRERPVPRSSPPIRQRTLSQPRDHRGEPHRHDSHDVSADAHDELEMDGLSVGTYTSNIRNGDTGAKRLDLPLVAISTVTAHLTRSRSI